MITWFGTMGSEVEFLSRREASLHAHEPRKEKACRLSQGLTLE